MSARSLRWITVAGIVCVVVGVVIALVAGQASAPVPGEAMRYTEPFLPSGVLGWPLLIGGLVLAAGLLGFVLGARSQGYPAGTHPPSSTDR